MKRSSFLLLSAAATSGCLDLPPANVALTPAGSGVEILAETPSENVYEPFEEIVVQGIGGGSSEATRSARHTLRNRAAERGAHFVSVDYADAQFAWDFSGRTIVTIHGHAYRLKDDEKDKEKAKAR